ncbi:hypothetical protein NDU88_003651 [Pleurodeles waltl]|uniref:Uncharacterized protein n=1 Tax=Pleurodeles waltl TaxID=8319 RepID=A0AAV7TP17_PLEWA|nr:hypothetical protein NDU88_003651 [Pleurodeles waltl]
MGSQFDKILAAIVDTKTALQQDIGAALLGLGLLQAEHRKLAYRVQETERNMADICSAHKAVTHQVTELIDRVRRLEYRAEDAEGRNRCNNIRLVGLLEGVEGNDMWRTSRLGSKLRRPLTDSHLSSLWNWRTDCQIAALSQ